MRAILIELAKLTALAHPLLANEDVYPARIKLHA
jgi:hypothetical protein